MLLDRLSEMQEPTASALHRFQVRLGVVQSIGRSLDSQYVRLLSPQR